MDCRIIWKLLQLYSTRHLQQRDEKAIDKSSIADKQVPLETYI